MASYTIAYLLNMTPQPSSGQGAASSQPSGEPSSPPAAKETNQPSGSSTAAQETNQPSGEPLAAQETNKQPLATQDTNKPSGSLPAAQETSQPSGKENKRKRKRCHEPSNADPQPKRKRTNFSFTDLAVLEAAFFICGYPDSPAKEKLAKCLGFDRTQIMIWFQNRRARERKSGNKKVLPDLSKFEAKHVELLREYERASSHSESGYTPIFATQPPPQPQPQLMQPQLIPPQMPFLPFLPPWPFTPSPVTPRVVTYPTYHNPLPATSSSASTD